MFSTNKSVRNDEVVVRRFRLFELIYWIGNTTFYSFYVLFMTQKKLSNTEIGSVLSISALLMMLFLPIWGTLCDKLASTKRILYIVFLCSIAIMICVPTLPAGFVVAAAMCLLAIFESGIVSLSDGYIIQSIHHIENVSYGKIRLWGAVGAMVSLATSPVLLNRWGAGVIFYIYSGVLLILLFVLRGLPGGSGSPSPRKEPGLRPLLQNRSYVLFVLFACILYIPFCFTQSFLVILAQQVGGQNTLSYALLAGSVSEGVFYALSFYLSKKFKPSHLIVFSGLFFILRQILFLVCVSPIQLVLANLTLGPSFSLFTAASVMLIFDLAPQNLKSSAQALANAAIFGVSGIISNFGGGLLTDVVGIELVVQIGCAVSIAAYLAYIFLCATGRNRKLKI